MHPAAVQARFQAEMATLSDLLAERRHWVFHTRAFPLLDCSFTAPGRTTLRLRFTCDDWNDTPPAILLCAADGAPLASLPPNPTGVFNPGPHAQTGRPFICMRGAREYHTHPSHVGDAWSGLKDSSSYTLGGILTQLWRAWQKGIG